MYKNILITGGTGLIGRNLVERLKRNGCFNILAPNRSKIDLMDQSAVSSYFWQKKPDLVIHLAAKVGGIHANSSKKYDFYYENSTINNNVVNASISTGVKFFVTMGTGCAYPKSLEGEILREEEFLNGHPEPTNDAYAYAKRSLLVQLNAAREQLGFKSSYIIPANIYGPHDNFHPLHSHVVPGMIQRAFQVKNNEEEYFEVWGDGSPTRDFLFIEDLLDAIEVILEKQTEGAINVASCKPTKISDLASEILGAYDLNIPLKFNSSYPNGQTERLFDNRKITEIGWKPKINLKDGIERTVSWFENAKIIRKV
jgi:GDP-L-fucose synthase